MAVTVQWTASSERKGSCPERSPEGSDFRAILSKGHRPKRNNVLRDSRIFTGCPNPVKIMKQQTIPTSLRFGESVAWHLPATHFVRRDRCSNCLNRKSGELLRNPVNQARQGADERMVSRIRGHLAKASCNAFEQRRLRLVIRRFRWVCGMVCCLPRCGMMTFQNGERSDAGLLSGQVILFPGRCWTETRNKPVLYRNLTLDWKEKTHMIY